MNDLKWWQKAIFYQIYPRSYADSNGDGIGDLPGITGKLDYLRDLGIGGIWLSPFYPSPLVDCGYDVSDYTAVASEYGSLGDFQRLLDESHQRGIRVILDTVLNHTSDQHPWFQAASSSRNDPRHDWYVWQEGKPGEGPAGSPPNNWLSIFGGSAWEFAPAVGQYYYHYFFKQQPDLNWRNPEVKKALFDVLRFWLDMGVDGFRLDAITALYENASLNDHTADLSQAELYRLGGTGKRADQRRAALAWRLTYQNQLDQPEIHGLLREIHQLIDGYPERVLVGETDEIAYCHPEELHMVFNFPLMRTPHLTPAWVRNNQAERTAALEAIGCPGPGAWPGNTLGNHDSPRIYNRYGDGTHDAAQARLSLAVVLLLRGTPFLYYGEEIGMTDLYLDDLKQLRDSYGIWLYHMQVQELGKTPEEALQMAAKYTRDKCRTPMQWSSEANAGFSPAGIQTWLPVNPNYARGVNVAAEQGVQSSLLSFYQELIRVRNQNPALVEGEYIPVHTEARSYLSFLRRSPEQSCLVLLNMSAMRHTLNLSLDIGSPKSRLLFCSRKRRDDSHRLGQLDLDPFEVYISEIQA